MSVTKRAELFPASQTGPTGEELATEPSRRDIRISTATGLDLIDIWSSLQRPIKAFFSRHGGNDVMTEKELLRECVTGGMRAVGVREDGEPVACAFFSIQQRPSGRTMLVYGLVGTGHETWGDDLIDYLVEVSRAEGCRNTEVYVRPFIREWLKDRGWRVQTTVMEMRNG